MQSKSVSMIKKHRLIKQQLKNFPVFGVRNSTSSIISPVKVPEQIPKEMPKKRFGIQKGKSLQLQRKKIFQGTVSNFKKTTENSQLKSPCLLKKKRNKTIKQPSFSRTSLISSVNLPSVPSTTTLSYQTEILKLTQDNKKYKQIIEKQRIHIQSLECIIANF